MIEINEKVVKDIYINNKVVDKILFNDNLIFKRIPNNIIEAISSSEAFYYKVGWGDYTWLGTTPNVLTKFDLGKDPIWNLVFTNNVDVTYLDLTKVDLTNCGNGLYEICQNCPKLETIKFGKKLPPSNIMDRAFYECSSLKELDLSGLIVVHNPWSADPSGMQNTFFNCSSLTKLNLSNINASDITSLYFTFYNCSSLTELNLSSFNISNVTDMNNTFRYCSKLKKLDLSSFNTSKVTTMLEIFCNMDSLEELILGKGFDVSKIPTSGQNLFGWNTSLKKITCPKTFKDFCDTYSSNVNLAASVQWNII